MKALISPNELFTWTWVTSWEWGPLPTPENPTAEGWIPDTTESIENCQRVAEVEPTLFEVAQPLFWIDCPDDCVRDEWYFKDGQVQPKPQSVPVPSNPT
jgi:hypothetical protein